MNKIAFILLLFLSSVQQLFSQGSYQFFSVRAGMTHNLNIQPPVRFRYFTVDEKMYRLIGGKSTSNYTSGYYFDLNFHYDLENDLIGFFGGLEYNNYGFKANYQTIFGDSTLIEINKMTSIGVPLAIKIGTDMYNLQNYFYAGIQINYNLQLSRKVQPSYGTEFEYSDNQANLFNNMTYFIFVGYNYFIWNIEVSYIPTNFPKEISSNLGLPDRMFLIKTGIHVPISAWTKEKYKNFRREIRRNKSKRF